jgi:hypothetical protein
MRVKVKLVGVSRLSEGARQQKDQTATDSLAEKFKARMIWRRNTKKTCQQFIGF